MCILWELNIQKNQIEEDLSLIFILNPTNQISRKFGSKLRLMEKSYLFLLVLMWCENYLSLRELISLRMEKRIHEFFYYAKERLRTEEKNDDNNDKKKPYYKAKIRKNFIRWIFLMGWFFHVYCPSGCFTAIIFEALN